MLDLDAQGRRNTRLCDVGNGGEDFSCNPKETGLLDLDAQGRRNTRLCDVGKSVRYKKSLILVLKLICLT
ncbi:hypothetical protein J4434_08615 [Candidatus Woesearchaeota archaeon]|nr:hypothetical protein [Candidatus Woesearchaeota archaeon]